MTPRFYFYLLLLLTISLIGIVRFKKLTIPFKLITILIIYTFASEIISRIFSYKFRNSSPVYHLYIPIQFALLLLVYFFLFQWKNWRYTGLILFIFLVLCFTNTIFLQSFFRFPSNIILISSCFFIGASLSFFKRMLNSVGDENLFKQSVFWFNTGILIFFTCTFLFWGIYNYLLKDHISTKPISTIVYFINILFYAMVGTALILDNNKKNKLNE